MVGWGVNQRKLTEYMMNCSLSGTPEETDRQRFKESLLLRLIQKFFHPDAEKNINVPFVLEKNSRAHLLALAGLGVGVAAAEVRLVEEL